MAAEEIVSDDVNGDNAKRERSTVDFPYTDLESAMEIATAIHNHAGHGECTTDQIAAKMGTTEASSTFRVKLSSAKLFNMIEGGRGTFKLTDLGTRIIDPQSAAPAKAEAFLGVELYRKVFETYKGKMLPPSSALEKQLEDFGVSTKQKDRARQVLERSAKFAGFSDTPGRLVAPALVGAPKPKQEEKPLAEVPPQPQQKTDQELHPFIKGLLEKLPKPESDWPVQDRVQWLQTTSHIFALMYKGEGKIKVEVDK